MSPYAEYPKTQRSSEWGRETIEMQENGSTKNLLQMTDVYYSVSGGGGAGLSGTWQSSGGDHCCATCAADRDVSTPISGATTNLPVYYNEGMDYPYTIPCMAPYTLLSISPPIGIGIAAGYSSIFSSSRSSLFLCLYLQPGLRTSEIERNGLCPYTGLPGSRHSCIYPGQYNPTFINEENRRRDYF